MSATAIPGCADQPGASTYKIPSPPSTSQCTANNKHCPDMSIHTVWPTSFSTMLTWKLRNRHVRQTAFSWGTTGFRPETNTAKDYLSCSCHKPLPYILAWVLLEHDRLQPQNDKLASLAACTYHKTCHRPCHKTHFSPQLQTTHLSASIRPSSWPVVASYTLQTRKHP